MGKQGLYSIPFEILREKVPFLEYLIRVISFALYPKIETMDQFKTGDLRFGLWDIILTISLFGTTLGLLSIFYSDSNLSEYMAVFTVQFMVPFEFGWYAFSYTAIFYCILLAVTFALSLDKEKAFRKAFLIALHYARCYALFLFLIMPLIPIYLHVMFKEVIVFKEFAERNYGASLSVSLVYVALYVWCCVIPIYQFWKPVKSKFLSLILSVVVTILPFSFSSIVPRVGVSNFNQDRACELYMKSKKFESLTVIQRKKFRKLCLEKLAQ